MKRVFDFLYRTVWFHWAIVGPFLIVRHRRRFGRWPTVAAPKTFTEKLLHRMIFDRGEALRLVSGKLEGRELVAARMGDETLLTELVATISRASDLARITLPAKFILKANHMSGLTHIHDGAAPADAAMLGELIEDWCTNYRGKLSWGYRDIRRTVLIEKLLLVDGAVPKDYKFFCYDGVVHFVQVDGDRFSGHKRDYFDRDWQHLDMSVSYPHAAVRPERPARLADMIQIAERLSSGFDFVRVDLYAVGDQVKFGELTPYPGGAWERFEPVQWDVVFGAPWTLPSGHQPGRAATALRPA